MRKSVLVMRMCWESIIDLITGRYTLAAVSGPVGISGAIGDAARQGAASLLNITLLISMNLGFMNLLPIPALDGGRLLFLLFEAVARRPLDKKVEGYIHFIGMMILFGIMILVTCKDIVGIFIR